MTISWAELVVLMGFGDGREDRISGLLRVREVDPLPDDVPDDEAGGTVELHPTLGRVLVRESGMRVLRRGDLVRTETPEGRVVVIFGVDTNWVHQDDAGALVAYPACTSSFGWAGANLVQRLAPSRWEGEDFTRLTGAIEATEFLGRAAWAFELAPPRHKPHPIQMIVDASTGLVLRQGSHDFGSVTEWVELDLDADLPDELFVWDGPTRAPDDARAEHEAEMAVRRAWLDARGIVVELPVRPQLMLHDWSDETGAFQLSIRAMADGHLMRRPASDEHWADAEQVRYEHSYRWRDARWDWLLGTSAPVADEQLALLRVQLAKSS